MSAIASVLAGLAVVSFFMTSAGFLALAWRGGWAMGRFVSTVESAAGTVKELVGMVSEFVQTQGKRNDEFELALQVQAERLNRVIERQATDVRGIADGEIH